MNPFVSFPTTAYPTHASSRRYSIHPDLLDSDIPSIPTPARAPVPNISHPNLSAIEHWPGAAQDDHGWLNTPSSTKLPINGTHSGAPSTPIAATRRMRVAAVQAAPIAYDLHKSLHKLRSLVFAARENGAEMVVLPEAFLSAYPRHLSFHVGNRTESNREWYGRYVKSSVKVPHNSEGRDWLSTSKDQRPDDNYWAFQQLAQIARKYSLYLSVGIIECSNVGSTLWCTNLLFGPSGMLLAKHRKVQPTGAERIVWSQGEATNPTGLKRSHGEEDDVKISTDNLPVVSTPVGKIGALICWENYMPLARYLMYKKGVEM